MSVQASEDNRSANESASGAGTSFVQRHWALLVGFGVGTNIYLHAQKELSAVGLIFGATGFVLLLVGLNALRTSNRREAVNGASTIELNSPEKEARPSTTSISRLRSSVVSNKARILAVLWVAAGMFCILHISTTVGERWVWKLGTVETPAQQTNNDPYAPKAVSPLRPGSQIVNGTPSNEQNRGDIFDQAEASGTIIEALPSYVLLHELEVSFAALVVFASLFPKDAKVVATTRLLRNAEPIFLGLVFILPLIWVPCVWTVHYHYGSDNHSDYRWLWRVGATHIQLTTVFFEELVLAVISIAITLTFKAQRNLASQPNVEATNYTKISR